MTKQLEIGELTPEEKVLELEKELIAKEKELTRVTTRAMAVHKKNEQLVASPEIAAKMAEMDYQMMLAERFIKSKAFPNMTPEQAFTIMRAGKEMGMSEIESLNSLYIVNGKIEPYGKAMVNFLKKGGFTPHYENESDKEVTVTVEKDGYKISEKVTDQDQIIKRSKAAGFAKKNKMRYHGVRMVLNFHLPHLIKSTADLFDAQYHAFEEIQVEEKTSRLDKILEEE